MNVMQDTMMVSYFTGNALPILGYSRELNVVRVVPGFLVQTGDRTGTGGGGESFFGGKFMLIFQAYILDTVCYRAF